MQDNEQKKFFSIDEIRSRYNSVNKSDSVSSVRQDMRVDRELTASAKHVVREAKKVLANIGPDSFDRKVPSERNLVDIVRSIEESEGEDLTARERDHALKALSASLDHYDILTPLIQNPSVNDIIISKYNDISIQVERRNIQTDISFPDHESYLAFIESLLKRAGKSCTVAMPVVDVAVDPSIRACVTHESLSPHGMGPLLTLRVSRFKSISLNGLCALGLAPKEVFDYLSGLMRVNEGAILIAGEVGTGKTTLVRALTGTIDEAEAILVIEDTNEIELQRAFVRTILTRESNLEGIGKVSPAQAIRAGMRMAMNRIILGEIRDGEAAEAFVDVCSSGHPGISTVHAKSARDAIGRMELFLSRAQGEVGIDTIRKQIANAITVVVYIGIDQVYGKRKILSVHEIENASDGSVRMGPMYEYSNDFRAHWKRGTGISKFQGFLSDMGIRLSPPGTVFDVVEQGNVN